MKIGMLGAAARSWLAGAGERAAAAGRGLAARLRGAGNADKPFSAERPAAARSGGWQRFAACFQGGRAAPRQSGLTRGGLSRAPISPGDVKAVMRRQADELGKALAGDAVFCRQALESTYAVMYSEAKNAFHRANGGVMPEGYLRALGEIARDAGLPGREFHGAFIPAGDGASPFVTSLLSPVQKQFSQRVRHPGQQALFREHAKQLTIELVAPHAQRHGWEPPAAFQARLEAVGQPWLGQP
ncbi:hypothetical protein [Chromobacterium subtsugae]|uniref:hypothetical protein n=1 Tax=Chromobacterium subtsugae TaxID=251747 RepID=UPI0007F864D5|nr:hypothetical protein [Chromobacterium subtsugae]OBU86274.1 hypothetical protein MY55_11435 [Chromobacterium subtsugae]